jgi:hypothetical protein
MIVNLTRAARGRKEKRWIFSGYTLGVQLSGIISPETRRGLRFAGERLARNYPVDAALLPVPHALRLDLATALP